MKTKWTLFIIMIILLSALGVGIEEISNAINIIRNPNPATENATTLNTPRIYGNVLFSQYFDTYEEAYNDMPNHKLEDGYGLQGKLENGKPIGYRWYYYTDVKLKTLTDNLTAAQSRIAELESRPIPTVTITVDKIVEKIVPHNVTILVPQPYSFVFGDTIEPKPFHAGIYDCDDSAFYTLLFFSYLSGYEIQPWEGTGYVTKDGLPTKHAWIEVTSGNITLAYDYGVAFEPKFIHNLYPISCHPITTQQLIEYVLMDYQQ